MPKGTTQDPVRVAVVGTGLAGLATAYLLETVPILRPDGSHLVVQVDVFEKSSSLGMDSTSISIPIPGKNSFRIDTPMRSINGGSHDRVWKLYQHLSIPLREATFTYSFSDLSSIPPLPPPHGGRDEAPTDEVKAPLARPLLQTPLFIYEGKNGMNWPPLALPSTLRTTLRRATYLSHLTLLVFSYVHLLLLAFFYYYAGLLGSEEEEGLFPWAKRLGVRNVASEPLASWCRRHHVWREMREEILEPLMAAVSSVGRDEVEALPTGEVLGYIVSTFGASHYVTATGVMVVVAHLSAPLRPSAIHLGATITSLSPSSTSPLSTQISFSSTSSPEPKTLTFDHVVLATQANQASAILSRLPAPTSSPSPLLLDLQKSLSSFTYLPTLVVNHTDTSLLPHNPLDRRDLNLASFTRADAAARGSSTAHTVKGSGIQATHILSRTHPALREHFGDALLQTTNPLRAVRADQVLSETWYERAVVTRESQRVLPRFLLRDPERRGEREMDGKGKSGRKERGDLQGRGGIWFVGSYCAEGLPLLEGCVLSAERAVGAIARQEGATFVVPF